MSMPSHYCFTRVYLVLNNGNFLVKVRLVENSVKSSECVDSISWLRCESRLGKVCLSGGSFCAIGRRVNQYYVDAVRLS